LENNYAAVELSESEIAPLVDSREQGSDHEDVEKLAVLVPRLI
jgi:hypothetical protein